MAWAPTGLTHTPMSTPTTPLAPTVPAYKTTRGIIGSLVVFPPVGIALTLLYSTWGKRTRQWAIAASAAWGFIMFAMFTAPAPISITQPANGSAVQAPTVVVQATGKAAATLTANGIAMQGDGQGGFTAEVPLEMGYNSIEVKSADGASERVRVTREATAEEIAAATPKTPAEIQAAITKAIYGDFTVVIRTTGGALANDATPPPYDVIISAPRGAYSDDCFGAKQALLDTMKRVYSPTLKEHISRTRVNIPSVMYASLGGNDGRSMDWKPIGPSLFWKNLLVFSGGQENESGALESRTWGVASDKTCTE